MLLVRMPSGKRLKLHACGLDSIAVYPVLAPFLAIEDLFQLWCCNHDLRKALGRLFISRVCWSLEQVLKLLRETERSHVRRLRVQDIGQITAAMRGHVTMLVFEPPLDGVAWTLPPNLTELRLGSNFNRDLVKDVLPTSLTRLVFGFEFDHPIAPRVLPAGLQYLAFGYRFNQSLPKGVLPSSLRSLHFGYHFNQDLSEVATLSNLFELTLGHSYTCNLFEGVLPNQLAKLTFNGWFNQQVDVLPSSITDLSFNGPLILTSTFPTTVTCLHFGPRFESISAVIPFGKHSRLIFEEAIISIQLSTLRSVLPYFQQCLGDGTLPDGVAPLARVLAPHLVF